MNKSGMVGASKWVLFGLFCAIALALTAGGYWFYRHEAEAIRIHQYGDLKAIADLKVNQILRWRNERMADARQNSSAPFLRSAVIQWIKTPNDMFLKKRIKTRLQLLKDAEGYQNVFLADTKDHILLTLDPHLADLEAETKKLVAKTASVRNVVFGDFFRCPYCKQIHLDVAAPILDKAQKPAAILILRSNPEEYLYPLIQSWPTASKSAETLLIRKMDQDVLFLNVLRHKANPALTLRISLSRTDMPAVQATKGKGLFEGLDYRGIKVLSDIRAVPGTSWFMVAKVDRAEILAEARERARLIWLLTLILVILSGVSMAFFYKHQGKRAFQALYQAEYEKAELLEQARVTLYSIGDAVITTGADGRVKQMNPVAEKLTGWKEAEAPGKPLSQVFHIVNEETRTEVDNPVERVLREGLIVGLANHTLLIAKDGTERPIADSGAPIRNEAGEIFGVVLVFRDQTEERKRINEIIESEEKLGKEKYLSDSIINSLPGIFYLFDQTGKFIRWNKNFEVATGRSAEEIADLNPLDLFEGEEKDLVAQRIQEVFDKGASDVEAHLVSKDGTRTPYYFTGLKVVLGGRICLSGVGMDITERKQSEVALAESEIRFRTFSETAPLGISFIDVDGRYEYVNPAFVSIFGWDLSDISTGRDWFELAFPDPDYRRQVIAAWKEDLPRYKEEKVRLRTYEVMCKDSARKTVLFRSVTLPSGMQFIIYEDITERKQAQEAFLALSSHQEALLSAIPDIIMEVDDNKVYTWANQAGYEFFGQEVIGKEAAFYFKGEQDTYQNVQPLFNGDENIIYVESWQRRKDGKKRLLAWWCRVLKDEQGKVIGALSTARDITIQKQGEQALKESEERYRTLVRNANETILVVQDETIKFNNPKAAELFGYTNRPLPADLNFLDLVHPEDREMITDRYQRRMRGEDFPHSYSYRILDGQGKMKWVDLNSALISWQGRPAIMVLLEDITERKNTEEKIILAKEEWERTFDSVPDLIAIVDNDYRISRVNRAMAERLNRNPQELVGGLCYELFHGLKGPVPVCPHPQVITEKKEISAEFQEPVLGGYFLLTGTPLYGADGKSLGVIHVFRDITDRKKAEEKVLEGAGKLRKAIEGIVQAMAATVEVKDPYTAGHQHRVADLSRAIAQEMGFSEDRINGIHMAAMIHDLGKLSVPAEILSKPTQLTEIEFNLIKVHPWAGYEILKEIDFPWPIARIVFQHHERINGSGYPLQINGEEILPEAKVLAVADVVEAIASHRPYRPAHGIDKALEEITKNKGILYDPEVVEACLRLFEEKRFTLE